MITYFNVCILIPRLPQASKSPQTVKKRKEEHQKKDKKVEGKIKNAWVGEIFFRIALLKEFSHPDYLG